LLTTLLALACLGLAGYRAGGDVGATSVTYATANGSTASSSWAYAR